MARAVRPLSGNGYPASAGTGPVRILLDTNVVVGLWLGDARLDGLQQDLAAGRLPLATSPALLAESRDVLMRPDVRRDRGYGLDEVEAFLGRCFGQAELCPDPPADGGPAPRAPDPGDQFLWNLLAARPHDVLWTRDVRLLRDRAFRGRVCRPPGDAQG